MGQKLMMTANGSESPEAPETSSAELVEILESTPELKAIAEIERILSTIAELPSDGSYRTPQQRVLWYVAERYGLVGKPKYPGPRGGRDR